VLLKYDDRVKTLRQKLRAMTGSGRKPNEHRNDLKAITHEISNTIRVLHHELSGERYTCGMHALGLEQSEEYVAIAGHGWVLSTLDQISLNGSLPIVTLTRRQMQQTAIS
jgi:hypothetical protein